MRKTIITCIICLLSCVGYLLYINKAHTLQYMEFKYNYSQNTITLDIDRNTAKKMVLDNINTPHLYFESELGEAKCGVSSPFTRVVIVDKDIDVATYIIAYTHELIHVKYQTVNERYTAYKTFLVLYESGNKTLKQVAMYYAKEQLNGQFEGTDYDCSWYIDKYLKG